jgi:hypothetical protein
MNPIQWLGVFASVGVVTLAGAAKAQCDTPFTVTFTDSIRREGPPEVGQSQTGFRAWTYFRKQLYGPLLTGVELSGVNVPFWGSPGASFNIPGVGAIWSPDPLVNQVQFFSRQPSFTGAGMIPGETVNDDLVVSFNAPVTLTAARFRGEVIGGLSDGVIVSMRNNRNIGGQAITLIPPTLIPYTTSGSTTLDADPSKLPLTLNGDNEPLYITVNRNGNYFEDWFNTEVTLTMTGGPVIYAQPRGAGVCQNTPTVLRVGAAASGDLTYRWQKAPANSNAYIDLSDGLTASGAIISGATTDTLTVTKPAPADGGKYRVRVSNPCRTAFSSPGIITVCVADYDCSGFTDTDDFTAFVLDFEAGLDDADVDGTGFVDTDDFTFYVLAFEAGC